jgi:2-dehydro-3-deoxygluconokinase
VLQLRPAAECDFDVVALGEVMLRFDPGEGRVRTARSFRVWEGGGEYNVARGAAKCFGLRAAIVTSLVDNEVGRLVLDLINQGTVDSSLIRWLPFDGIGRDARNGLNFTERGFGVRGALGTSDRGHTAIAQLRSGEIDWDDLFGRRGVRWLHTGGIYAGLSEHAPAVIEAAMHAARRHGTVVSYDLNYRPSIWAGIGGGRQAQRVNVRLTALVDVLLGNEEDFVQALGFELRDVDEHLRQLPAASFRTMIDDVVRAYPNLQAVATTLRAVPSASVNDWGAILWCSDDFYEATPRPGLAILDRVGGGDSFASGLVYGFLTLAGPAAAVEYGAAHGALAMSTPGDTSMATLAEVEALVRGGSPRVRR